MAWTVDINGTDITSIVQSINWHPRWSRPATCVINYPAHLYQCQAGDELHLYNSGSLKFSGPVWHIDAQGQPNRTDAEITAYDHLIYFNWRLCKQGLTDPEPFNLIEPAPVILENITAPQIMSAFVQNALDDTNAADPPSKPMPWIIGSTSTAGPDVTGVPTSFPMSLDQMRQMLLSTGQLAIEVIPGIGASTLNFIRPPTSVGSPVQTFEYQTGSFNSQNATITDDMDVLVNALWYLLGPRGPTHAVRPNGTPRFIPINHWGGSITPTAANAGGDGTGGNPGTPWPPATVARFRQSRVDYGYSQEIRIFDTNEDEDNIRELYEEMWNNEAWIRATPRRFVGIIPERGVNPTFNVGQFVGMAAGSRLHGGESGTLLVFEFEVQINVNGVVAITEIVASENESGAGSVS